MKKLCSYTVLQPKKKRIQAPPRLTWASAHLISHQAVKGSTTKTKDTSSKPAHIKHHPAHFATGKSVVHINRHTSSLFLRPNNELMSSKTKQVHLLSDSVSVTPAERMEQQIDFKIK